MDWKNRGLRFVVAGLVVTACLAIYAGLSLMKKKDEYRKLNAEYELSVTRAGEFVEAFSQNIKTVRSLIDSMPFCDDNRTFFDNKSFEPAIPYFISAEDNSFVVNEMVLGKTVKPLFLFPLIGIDRFPVVSRVEGDQLKITFDYDLLREEVKASDMAVIATQKGKLCRVNLRLYAAKKTEDAARLPMRIFGRIGMQWGRFSLPYGTDIDQTNNTVMISDCTNGLIQEFDFAGHLVRIIGGNGDKPAQMSRPADVKIDHGKIYVVEENNHRYQVFSREGDAIGMVGAHKKLKKGEYLNYEAGEDPAFNNPLGIAVDKDENIFVVDYDNYRVVKIGPDGKVIKVFGGSQKFDGKPFNGPYYIDINHDLERVYVVDRKNDRITVFDLNGMFLFAFGAHGAGDGELDYPHEIDVAVDGRVFVADTNNRRIQVFDENGQYLDKIVFGTAYGLPKTVAVSDEGFVIAGHVGWDSYMTVWRDPLSGKERSALREYLLAQNAPESVDLKYKKAKIDQSFDGTVYKRVCASCHETGAANAPKTKNVEDWERFPRNLNALLALARQGKGAMMPSGGCAECSDEELLEAIKFMLPDTWDKE